MAFKNDDSNKEAITKCQRRSPEPLPEWFRTG